jgi:hypothetical protein
MKSELTGFFVTRQFNNRHAASYGELTPESGKNIGIILLYKGDILQAFSPYSRAVGNLLVEDRLIIETELNYTLKLQKNDSSLPLAGCV